MEQNEQERDGLQETAEHPLLEDEAQFAAVPEKKRQLREAQQKAKEYLDLLLENAGRLRELSAAYEPGASRDARYRSDWAAQPTLAGPR